MSKREIYVSIDIEANGPIPGQNSMLNFGAAAFDLESNDPLTPIATFEVNLFPLENGREDSGTMDWWKTQPEAWAYVHKNRQHPIDAIRSFLRWTDKLPGSPVMVTYPAYDFMWMHWYIMRFGGRGRSPYSFATLDIKTMAMLALNCDYKAASKRLMSKKRSEWFKGQPPHDHTGLSDAIGQGMLFVKILRELRDKLDPEMYVVRPFVN